MTAYITIVNDSRVPWLCKVKSQVPELSWQGIAPAVLATVTAAFAIDPALTTRSVTDSRFGVYGAPASLMGGNDGLVATGVINGGGADGTTRIGSAIAGGILKSLRGNDYVLMMPGEQNKFSDLPIKLGSLQVDCKQVSTGGTHASMGSLWMDSVVIGKKDSNLEYSMQVWIKKNTPKYEVIDAYNSNMAPTIVNDTPSPWVCKVFTGREAMQLSWQDIAQDVLSSVTKSFAINPALSARSTASSIYGVYGVPASLMEKYELAATGVVKGSDSTTRIGGAIAGGALKALQDTNYRLIMPGEHNKLKDVSVSGTQQVDCKRISTSGIHTSLATLWVNDIAMGKQDSNLEYSIKSWLSKKQPSIEVIDAFSGTPKTKTRG